MFFKLLSGRKGVFIISKTNDMKSKFLKSLFPFKKPILPITIMGMMLGVRIALGYFFIPLGPTVLSFTWLSLFITGFIIGPLLGYAFGWISDSVSFGIHGGVYMWEFSIQESAICMIAGIAGLLYRLFKDTKASLWSTFVIFELIFTVMVVIGLYMMIKYFDFSHVAKNGGNEKWIDSKWVKIFAISLIGAFYLFLNGLVLFMMLKHKGDPRIIMLVSLVVIVSWITFSWIEGPWAYVRYYEKLHGGSISSSYKAYGYKFYSISRILKSLFVVPIEITITLPIVKAYSVFSKRSESIH